jgi:non-specific protein-tyrosine kinase
MMAPGSTIHNGGELVALTQPRSAAAEAYRTLRINIRFRSLDRPARTILFTSPGPREGKSTTLANLAIIAAQAGSRVVAVDCDLRKPALHTLFGVPNSPGLADLVLDDLPRKIPTQVSLVKGLWILPSGALPPNPAELLSLERVDHLLASLLHDADLLMLDSPPAAAVADASILGPRVDGVVLVIDATHTRREQARRAKEQLERVNAHILGVVLNRARTDSSTYQYDR